MGSPTGWGRRAGRGLRLPAPAALFGIEEQWVAEAPPQVRRVREETRGRQGDVGDPPPVLPRVLEPLVGERHQQEHADISRGGREPGEQARQEQVPPDPEGPQGASREREEQTLSVGRVQEEASGEEGEGQHRRPRRALAPPVFGYPVDEVEGEGQREQGDYRTPRRERLRGDGSTEELGEGPDQERVERKKGGGAVPGGLQVPARGQRNVCSPSQWDQRFIVPKGTSAVMRWKRPTGTTF